MKIDSGSQPLAFGSLLESPSAEEEDSGYATTARPQLERDWGSGSEEEEVDEEVEEDAGGPWRRDAGDEAFAQQQDASGPVKDWRETALPEVPGEKHRHEAWAPGKEKSDFAEAAESTDNVRAIVAEAPFAGTKEEPAPAGAFSGDAWAAALSQKSAVEASTWEAPTTVKAEPATEPPTVAPSVSGTEIPAPEYGKQAESTPWYSAVASPWDAEVQKATQLASTWDSPAGAAPAVTKKEDPAATVDTLPQELSESVKAKIEEAALPAATVEAIREEAQQVATQEMPIPAATSGAPKTQEPSMEDLVAKVLSKMSPDVLQAVTREILKPVVEAMVREEMNSKK